jgi:hypothetical protein
MMMPDEESISISFLWDIPRSTSKQYIRKSVVVVVV